MMIASLTDGERNTLVIGLHADNIVKLRNDMPIHKHLDEDPAIPGLEGWDIVILGPEDLERFVARYNAGEEPELPGRS